jgi:hypothetical protein
MNTILNAPTWAEARAKTGTLAAELRQLVNAAGPLSTGMAVALAAVQASEQAEHEGETPTFDREQRGCLLSLCVVAAQMLGEAALDGCNALINMDHPSK